VVDDPTVMVDALNVMRSRWPNLPEDGFVDLTRAWADHERVRALIVFDGRAPGDRTGVWELDERTSVVGTGGGSADDWIARDAERMASEGQRIWLVSSDRGLRARVAQYVERTIGGGSFAGQLEMLEREQ
jgi:hypothetical protein